MFDSLTELIEKIYLGEDSTIEFKKELSPKKDERSKLADEIAAFANAEGGVILIGVDDNGEIVGIDSGNLNQSEKIVIEICRDSIEPPVNIHTEKLNIDDKPILKIEISRSLFVHKSPNGYFRRQGSSKREMPTEELARLMQSRSQARIIPFDEQFVPETHKGTLSKELYQRFTGELETDKETESILFKRHLLVKENNIYRASVAGVLMCNHNPDEFIDNSFIQAVYYSGITRDANYQIDAKDFKGTLDKQIIDAFNFVKKHNRISARKEVGREEKSQYSMRAIFEAVVNAVVHRDYSKHSSKIRLFMFADRLEIYSPGSLANSLTVDNLPYNQVTRNELLARLLSELTLDNDNASGQIQRKHFLERRGEGVGIILDESERLSGKKPLYEVLGEELRLTVFTAESLQKLEND
jgi:ATP-dependent DNA helicase RecG